MIMKKIIFFVAAIAALVVTSCSKDNVASDNGVKYVTEFTVDFENSTRVSASYVTGSGLDFMFNDNDLVHVWNATTAVRHTSYRYNSTAGKFILANSQPAMVEGEKYFLTFNCNSADSTPKIVDGKLTVKWYYTQPYGRIADLPLFSDVFIADANGTLVTMHHVYGMLEIPVTVAEGKTVSLTSVKSSEIMGNPYMQLTFDADGLVENADIVCLNQQSTGNFRPLTSGISNIPANTYLFPFPPRTYSTVTIGYRVDGVEGTKTITISDLSLTVERGKIHKRATPIALPPVE